MDSLSIDGDMEVIGFYAFILYDFDLKKKIILNKFYK